MTVAEVQAAIREEARCEDRDTSTGTMSSTLSKKWMEWSQRRRIKMDSLDVQPQDAPQALASYNSGSNIHERSIPGSNPEKFIYTLHSFSVMGVWTSEELSKRVAFVKDHLVRVVDDHLPDLDSMQRRPTFNPYMVGTSSKDVCPSIVVTCQSRDFKRLSGVFRSKCEKDLNLCSNWKRIVSENSLSRERGETSIPLLYLAYFRIPIEPTVNRQGADARFNAFIDTNEGYCGSLIRHEKRTATLGAPILMKGEVAFLTVSHLFCSSAVVVSPSKQHGSSIEPQGCDPDGHTETGSTMLSDDDDEYFELDADENCQRDEASAPSYHPDLADMRGNECQTWERIFPNNGREAQGPYLDWALTRSWLRWGARSLRIRGVPSVRGNDGIGSTVMSKVRHTRPEHLQKVSIVSGRRGIIHGRILEQESYLPSLPRRGYAAVWSVFLDEPSGLIDGECGSVVMDDNLVHVYGHVVGSDPFGVAYVAPLKHVLDQIKSSFETTDVWLPTIEDLLDWAMRANDNAQALDLVVQGSLTVETEGKVLLWAAQRGFSGVVTQLLRSPWLDFDKRDSGGRSALSWAAGEGHFTVVDLLVKTKSIEPAQTDRIGKSPLAYATAGKHQAIMNLLKPPVDDTESADTSIQGYKKSTTEPDYLIHAGQEDGNKSTNENRRQRGDNKSQGGSFGKGYLF